MNQTEKTKALLLKHYRKYPQAEICDIFKFLHQSAFGCEHAVPSAQKAIEYIKKEWETIQNLPGEYVEALDGEFSRVPLSNTFQGLTPETLGKLFVMSATPQENATAHLKNKLKTARSLIEQGLLDFDINEFSQMATGWESQGFPALHHSHKFGKLYRPAYRVISNRYIPFLPLFAKLDSLLSEGNLRLAIEGGSASGKTTLGSLLEQVYNCTLFHMDDFFLRPGQRTPERLAEPGGNVDRERFLEEVLLPVSQDKTVNYRTFDCHSQKLSLPSPMTPKKLTVTEGAYSMHPELAKFYDFSVFLDIDRPLQRERILKRNSPQAAELFFNKWIPLEQKYFQELNIKQTCSMIISIT